MRKEVSDFCLDVTNIVLLPKIPNPTNMVNFRPINLCNVIYKIIAKMVANKFHKVLDGCIDIPQSAFVSRKFIGIISL